MDELLRLSNQHGFPAPRIEELPGRYIGCFMNAFGEQLVFVHDDGERDATLYHGDVDWEPRRVSDATGVAQVEDLILDRDERATSAPAGSQPRRGATHAIRPTAQRRSRA